VKSYNIHKYENLQFFIPPVVLQVLPSINKIRDGSFFIGSLDMEYGAGDWQCSQTFRRSLLAASKSTRKFDNTEYGCSTLHPNVSKKKYQSVRRQPTAL
jgi:hypothetical protein